MSASKRTGAASPTSPAGTVRQASRTQTVHPNDKVIHSGWVQRGVSYLKHWGQDDLQMDGSGNGVIVASPLRWAGPASGAPGNSVLGPGGARRAAGPRGWAAGADSSGSLIDRPKFSGIEALGGAGARKYRDDESKLTSRIQAAPYDGRAYAFRAFARNKLGKYDAALKDAARAVELSPADPLARYTRALAYDRLGQRERALSDLREAARLDPQYRQLAQEYAREMEADARAMADKNARAPSPPARPTLPARYAAAGAVAAALFLVYGLLGPWRARPAVSTASAPPPGTPAFSWGQLSLSRIGAPSGAVLNAPARALEGFQILRQIGQGGMGVVYEAMDLTLHRKVAVKKMRDEIAGDGRERRRFLKEARTVAALKHPHIVEIYSVLEHDGGIYLVFEHIDGEPLSQVLALRRSLPPLETVGLVRQVAQALDHAHGRGVIHRDLKPSNIMLISDAVKVMDFGIARYSAETLSTRSAGEVVGTPQYMAPEQSRGAAFNESDVYSLGLCAHEMLTGQLPLRAGAFPPNLPAGAHAVVARALDPDHRRRYPSAGALAAALEESLGPAAS